MKIRRSLRDSTLSEREFRLLFTGQALSVIGDGIAPIAIAFAVLDQRFTRDPVLQRSAIRPANDNDSEVDVDIALAPVPPD